MPPKEKQPLDAGFLRAAGAAAGGSGEVAGEAKRSGADPRRPIGWPGRRYGGRHLGIGGSYMGARAMLEACCHAYYNEVEPTMRRGRPRIYFEGNNVDNDALLDLVRLLESRGDGWGIVVISKSGGTLETAAAFRILLRELRGTLGGPGGGTGRSRRAGHREPAAGCLSWPRRWVAARFSGARRRGRTVFGVCRRLGCCRRRSLGSTSSSCLEGAAR